MEKAKKTQGNQAGTALTVSNNISGAESMVSIINEIKKDVQALGVPSHKVTKGEIAKSLILQASKDEKIMEIVKESFIDSEAKLNLALSAYNQKNKKDLGVAEFAMEIVPGMNKKTMDNLIKEGLSQNPEIENTKDMAKIH